MGNTSVVHADSDDSQPLDCLSCHPRDLEYHDVLGTGNNACWSCHDETDMSSLKLANGTLVHPDDSNELCGQCHQARYEAWREGTHGFPGVIAEGNCIACHNPHEPQVSLQGKTKQHPEPAPSPPDPPFDFVMIASVSAAFMTGLGIIVVRRGTE